ncbi:hypothetical protein [Psychromicrobium xiongbiense]|uniref:hypothetical protein n=1 Tax=Psychromicrobium xiongbiense TaxID=3051184 RepID=UPI00255625E6|nr:hypothetical protein [Psychromicrobium sp. YIM S02556]
MNHHSDAESEPAETEALPIPAAGLEAPEDLDSTDLDPADDVDDAEDPEDAEPFVPAPRYRLGRFSKILICVCLVLAGSLGGAAIQKAVDANSNRGGQGGFSQFQGTNRSTSNSTSDPSSDSTSTSTRGPGRGGRGGQGGAGGAGGGAGAGGGTP